MAGLRIPHDPRRLRKAFNKLKASVDLETEITLSPEEAGQLLKHIQNEQYRHRRTSRMPLGNPYE